MECVPSNHNLLSKYPLSLEVMKIEKSRSTEDEGEMALYLFPRSLSLSACHPRASIGLLFPGSSSRQREYREEEVKQPKGSLR